MGCSDLGQAWQCHHVGIVHMGLDRNQNVASSRTRHVAKTESRNEFESETDDAHLSDEASSIVINLI